MPVLLHTRANLPACGWARWVALDAAPAALPESSRLHTAPLLETAFDAQAATWWGLARSLAGSPGGDLAQTCATAANVSDFGLMLAWDRLVQDWAAAAPVTLVLCDDPWLFRHLAGRPGVTPGRAPALVAPTLRLCLRGWAARLSFALWAGRAAWRLRGQRRHAAAGAPHLLVYGHPRSGPLIDAYFGPLMQSLPGLQRVLHVDCPPDRAQDLAADGRTLSLHAWGSPLAALSLPFARWTPPVGAGGEYVWLVRRAAALESGTAQPAAIRWQQLCQRAWAAAVRPAVTAWPWENHAWERDLVRNLRRLGLASLGYQHTVIGPHMLNYAAHGNADGAASLPDRVLCSGVATRDQLAGWGVPANRLGIGGAMRFPAGRAPRHDRAAPIFLALPFDHRICAQMVDAAAAAVGDGFAFVVRDHPMMPFTFVERPGLTRASGPLEEQAALSAVVFAATTVGIEAVLHRLPALRFLPDGCIALDILPDCLAISAVERRNLAAALRSSSVPPPVEAAAIFAPVDIDEWRRMLGNPK